MAVAHVKSGASVGGGSGSTLAFTPNAVNDIIVVGAMTAVNGATLGISDTAGNTWTPISGNITDGSTTIRSWWAKANGTASTTITISGTAGFSAILVDEFSGQDTVSPISGHNETTGSGTPTVNVTPADNDCGLWGFTSDSVTAVGSGFTKGGDDGSQDWSEWKILTGGSGAAQTVSFTGSGSYVIGGAAIRPAASAGLLKDIAFTPGNSSPSFSSGNTTSY